MSEGRERAVPSERFGGVVRLQGGPGIVGRRARWLQSVAALALVVISFALGLALSRLLPQLRLLAEPVVLRSVAKDVLVFL